MSARDPLQIHLRRTLSAYNYFNQGEIWVPAPPREPVRIADMDKEWRFNCAQMLLRNAAVHADRYGWGEMQAPTAFGLSDDNADDLAFHMERWDAERMADPQAWMKTTRLYRALVAGLPTKPRKRWRLAERARHWSACPARQSTNNPCRCEAIRQEQEAAS